MEKKELCFYFKKNPKSKCTMPYVLTDYSQIDQSETFADVIKKGMNLTEFLNLLPIDLRDLEESIQKSKSSDLQMECRLDGKLYKMYIDVLQQNHMIIRLQPFHFEYEFYAKLIHANSKEAISFLAIVDNNIRYLYHNKEHEIITGISQEEIFGKSLQDVLGKEYYKKYEEEVRNCWTNQESNVFRATASWNGLVKERICRLDYVKEDCGYVMASELESDTIKEWLSKNEISFTKFDNMFHSHQAVMLLIEPESGIIIDANPAASNFYGYSHEELTSMTIQNINTLLDDDVFQKRQSAAMNDCQYFLFQHKIKNGEIRLVDVHSSPIEINSRTYLFSIITDATKRETNEQELYKEKELQKTTMDSIADAVVTTDNNECITYMNKAAEMASGWTLNECFGEKFEKIFFMSNEETKLKVPSIVNLVLRTGVKQELENHTLLHTKDKKMIPIEDSAAPIKDKYGNTYGAVVVFRDITVAKEKKNRIEYLSYHDALTGLYNRRYYYEYIDRLVDLDVYPLGFVMGDVNGLKMTNDVFGHGLGDKLLSTIGETLRAQAGMDNTVVRWGGDEFIIVIPKTSEGKIEALLNRVKVSLSKKSVNEFMEISISFGTAIKKNKWESSDEILKKAEELMYQKKLLESKSMRGNTIAALLTTLDEKSQETKEHTIRLTSLCKKIAERLDQHEEVTSRLLLLSALHDIGKVGIPDAILEKPGELSEKEWEIMRTHSEIGYRIALNVPELSLVAEEVLHHHERWDGSGYPSGLLGNQIPINCRILSVVDTYDAMTNDRVYRKAKTKQEAIKEIHRNSGSQFDPKIVEIFESLVEM